MSERTCNSIFFSLGTHDQLQEFKGSECLGPLGCKRGLRTSRMLRFSFTSLATDEGYDFSLVATKQPNALSDQVLRLLQPTDTKSCTQATRVKTIPKNLSTSESTSDAAV